MPTSDYLKIVDQFVSYARGLPLALKVLGSFLHRKTIDEWVSELDKLKKIPNITIQDVLRRSFDGLDDTQKDVFLDIACFFRWEHKDFVIAILKSCDFSPESDLRVLEEKSLITISSSNTFVVHDLLREMGWEIVRQDSIKEPGERSRLWLPEDICHIFKHNTGTKKVEGIFLDISKIEKVQLTRKAFRKMYNLRLLKIYAPSCYGLPDKDNIKVCLPQGLKGLSNELRYLHWNGYPLKYLPRNFEPKNLVELNMPFSNLEQPWDGQKDMKKLKRLVLSYSHNLKDTGDLSLAQNLEVINLEGCISLHKIDSSIQHLYKLGDLNLRGCTSLTSLPELPENIKSLNLDSTSIRDLPQFQHSNQLVTLSLKDCKFLLNLSNWFFSLTSLTELTLSGCSEITKLPCNLGDLSSLVTLEVEGIRINELPSSVTNLRSLKALLLSGCKGNDSSSLMLPPLWQLHSLSYLKVSDCNLVELPEGLVGLTHLFSLDLSKNNFERIDINWEPFSRLMFLYLRKCKMLRFISRQLPSNIGWCDTNSCNLLETVSSSICRRDDLIIENEIICLSSSLKFLNCFNLNQNTLTDLMSDVLARLKVDAEATQEIIELESCYSFEAELCYPGSGIPEWFIHQNDGYLVSFEMQPQMKSKLLGFIICAVLEPADYVDGCGLTCEISLTKIDGSLEIFSPFPNGLIAGVKTYMNADHLLIGYHFDDSLVPNGQDIYTNCVIEFNTSDNIGYPFECCNRKVKRCGGHPVYLVYCEEEQLWKFPSPY